MRHPPPSPDRWSTQRLRKQAEKAPFHMDEVLSLAKNAVQGLPKAALFELADEGYTTPFEQLVACIISVRTLDETTLRVARTLFAAARTPEKVARLGPERIDEMIRPCTFHKPKARQIHEIARRISSGLNERLLCDWETLLSFRGVGPKCAGLVLGIACGKPRISVDVHVHRVTYRWGYTEAKSPELALPELERKLPRKHWVEINSILVPFGKHICTRVLPRCSICPLLQQCRQVGVKAHR